MYSEPKACRKLASLMKERVSWLDGTHENDDGCGGLVLTLYGDRTHVQEVLGLEDHCFTFGVVIRLNLVFEKGERPPDIRTLYSLRPSIILVNADKPNAWSGGDLGSIAAHLDMKEDELHEVLSSNTATFQSEALEIIAEEYVQYLLTVEKNLAAIILSTFLTKGPSS